MATVQPSTPTTGYRGLDPLRVRLRVVSAAEDISSVFPCMASTIHLDSAPCVPGKPRRELRHSIARHRPEKVKPDYLKRRERLTAFTHTVASSLYHRGDNITSSSRGNEPLVDQQATCYRGAAAGMGSASSILRFSFGWQQRDESCRSRPSQDYKKKSKDSGLI